MYVHILVFKEFLKLMDSIRLISKLLETSIIYLKKSSHYITGYFLYMESKNKIKQLYSNVCPKCKSGLLKTHHGYSCHECDSRYDILNNIPILVDLNSLPKQLENQIQYFEKEKISTRKKYSVSPWQKNYVKRFLDNFELIEDKKILDCGTGSGYMAIELAKLGAKVVACDLTLNSLIRLKEVTKNLKSKHKIEFVCCTADELPFRSSYFDYFISNAVLEHIPREKKAIEEINRVTSSKAGMMVTVPIMFKYIFPLLRPINWIHDKKIGHLRRYDLRSIISKFKNWKIINIYYTGHLSKVVKTLSNIIIKIFDEESIEIQDSTQTSIPSNSSNIICFLKK